MDGNIEYISLEGIHYPTLKVSDYTQLLSYNGSALQKIAEYSGKIVPPFISELGTDMLHIYGWQGSTGVNILMDNFEAYHSSREYKSNFNDLTYKDINQAEISRPIGTTRGEYDSTSVFFGVFCKDNYAWTVDVRHLASSRTDVFSNGGDNEFGRKLYSIFKSGVPIVGGGAGSGYIGNSLVSNKKMVGYNVPTSSAEGTKTESVNDVSASAVSGKPKSGNGFARIKFLRDS